jgi:uncharacterized coiled-coil DUF342 family protein
VAGPTADELIALIVKLGEQMSAQLDALTAQVERMKTTSQSVVALVKGLADQIQAMKDDPAALQALADSLRTDADAIDQAVHDNTPAQP